MTIEQSLLALLAGGSPLPTAAENRVFAVLLPQDVALPAIVFQRISNIPVADYDGDDRRDFARVQIDAWAATYGAAKQLAEQVRELLAADAGLAAYMENQFDGYEPEIKLYRVSTDYMLTGAP